MLTVFIADDEIYIIELLVNLIDWKGMGLEITGTSNDGVTALKEIERLRPDIVITDIRMPGINGLELIESARRFNPDTAFIIISGHKNFQYAQTALQYGVKDYILKPIIADDLRAILTRVIEELNSAKTQSDEIARMNQNLFTAKAKLHNAYFDHLLAENELPCSTIEAANKEYYLEFKQGNFLFTIFKLDNKSDSADTLFTEALQHKALSIIQQYITPLCHEIIYRCLDSRFFLLCNYDPDNHTALTANMKKLLNSFEHELQKLGNLYFTVCKGSVQTDYANIPQSYRDAIRALRSRISGGLDSVIDPPRDVYSSKADLARILNSDQLQTLSKNIERFDTSELKLQITQLFALSESLGIEQADFYWDLATQIYTMFITETQHLNLFQDINTEKKDFLRCLEDCSSVNAMKSMLIQRILSCISRYNDTYDNAENISIILAKRYISEHYMEKITLNEIAQLLFFNPVYFSILFKREVGINFIDYVNNYRVEMSKNHLKDIAYTISDVAGMVGFSSTKYFTKIFKRIVGINPSQYRRKYIRHHTGNMLGDKH